MPSTFQKQSVFCEAILGIFKKMPLWVAQIVLEVLDDSHVKRSGQHIP